MSADPIDRRIGARLRARREARGLTMAALADATGVGPRALEVYETGAAPTPVSVIVKLAGALDISAGELIDDQSDDAPDPSRGGDDGSTELVLAFCAIPDARVRRAFLDLARTLVVVETQAEADN